MKSLRTSARIALTPCNDIDFLYFSTEHRVWLELRNKKQEQALACEFKCNFNITDLCMTPDSRYVGAIADENGKKQGELEGLDKYVKKFLPCLAKKTEFEEAYDKLSVPEKSYFWSDKIDQEKKKTAGEGGGDTDANPTSSSPEVEMGNVSAGETTNPMAKKDDV